MLERMLTNGDVLREALGAAVSGQLSEPALQPKLKNDAIN